MQGVSLVFSAQASHAAPTAWLIFLPTPVDACETALTGPTSLAEQSSPRGGVFGKVNVVLVDREIDASNRVVTLAVSGELSDEGLLSLSAALRIAPEVEPDFGLLIDLRYAVGRNVTTKGVQELAWLPLVFFPDSRRAVVVPSDLGFGMARIYQSLRDEQPGGGIGVFRDLDEARRWVIHSV